jgi:hypothetical protein
MTMTGSEKPHRDEDEIAEPKGGWIPLLDRQLPPSGLDIPMPPVKPPRTEDEPRRRRPTAEPAED